MIQQMKLHKYILVPGIFYLYFCILFYVDVL